MEGLGEDLGEVGPRRTSALWTDTELATLLRPPDLAVSRQASPTMSQESLWNGSVKVVW